jgi:UDP-sugar transporter A1/2/3
MGHCLNTHSSTMPGKESVADPSSMNPIVKLCMIGAMMGLYSMQSLLITASKGGRSGYTYDPNSAVLLTEFTKAIIAGSLLLQVRQKDPSGANMTIDKNCFRYAVPALLYAIHNNLVFLGLEYLDAPTYQLLNNIKIIVTGLLYRAFLKKPLRIVQWVGLGILMLGQMVATMDTSGGSGSRGDGFVTGVIVMCTLACMSGMAGVYNEFLLKGSSDSTHWQNLQLYMFSVFFCSLNYIRIVWSSDASGKGFFEGFETMTWAVILCSATMGQAVSFVLKYTDNITNRFATAGSLLLTTFGSWFFFGTTVETPFYLGVGLIAMAFGLYFVDHKVLVLNDEEALGCAQHASILSASTQEDSKI